VAGPAAASATRPATAARRPGHLSHYAQYNSGSPAGFADYSIYPSPKPIPCYGVYPTVIAYLKGVSGSYGAGNGKAQRVCLPWHT
jgi:hypothetical protein